MSSHPIDRRLPRFRPFAALLIAYILLASLYSITTPIFEASDEVWHYPMVRYMAQHGLAIPVQRPGEETAWRQEGSQPPLYYMLAALLTFPIDTDSTFDGVRRINPHADIGLIVPDGNVNMTIHDPAARGFPWRGTALAVHLARFFSVALGAITVWMTYHLANELFPRPDERGWGERVNLLALTAAAFTAFNPMFLFISGSVNNDNLSNALASALLVLIVRLLKRADQPTTGELFLIGGIAGAGMLAKFNIGFLLPIIGLALAVLAWRLRNWRFFIRAALITGGLTILIGGWWYLRNWQLYGDPTGLNVFIQIVGPRTIPANWAQLWAERHTFLMSYWGFFGGVNVPLPDAIYTIFNGLAAVAAVGLIWSLLRPPSGVTSWPILAGRALTLLWIVVLFGGLIRWTSETWASQGRLMFSAIAPISMWMAVGLFALDRQFRLRGRLAQIAAWWFLAIAVLGLLVIARTYDDPYPVPATISTLAADGFALDFVEPGSDQPVLQTRTAYYILPDVRPGEYWQLCVDLYLPPEPRFTRDWSAFIHLENSAGVIVAQRDVFLGEGLWATTLLNQRGSAAWCNNFAVRVPDHAYTPQNLRAYLGFYDLKTGERLSARARPNVARENVISDDRVLVAVFNLAPRPALTPEVSANPMQVNFGDEVELIGYSVTPERLRVRAGDEVTVTLYWRAHRPLTTDYRVFVQVVEPNTTNVFGQSDGMPAAWTRPTSTWQAGEVVVDQHTLRLNEGAPPGIWQLVVGLYEYRETDRGPQFHRLRILLPDGSQADDFLNLTRLRIDLP